MDRPGSTVVHTYMDTTLAKQKITFLSPLAFALKKLPNRRETRIQVQIPGRRWCLQANLEDPAQYGLIFELDPYNS